MKDNLSPKDLALLSAFLDDQLSASEQSKVQELLKTDRTYSDALKKMKRVKLILHALPPQKVPRNFSLSLSQAKPIIRIPSFTSIFQYSSMMATLILVVLLTFDFLPFLQAGQAQEVISAMPMAGPPGSEIQGTPSKPIIVWNNPVYGKGGGGGESTNLTAPATVPNEFVAPLESSTPNLQVSAQTPGALPTPDQIPPQNLPQTKSINEGATGAGPFLGIRPSDDQGQIQPLPGSEVQPVGNPVVEKNSLRTSEIILAAIAFFTGFLWFLFRKKN